MALMRISYQQLHETLRRVLVDRGFDPDRAGLCARLFAETDRDGVYSHGVNRFPRFLRTIENGVVDIGAEPTRVAARDWNDGTAGAAPAISTPTRR